MSEQTQVDAEDVRALAEIAELPLAEGREGPIAEQLAEWLTAANELNRKMSAAQHWRITPITVFTHPDSQGMKE
jgi:Asp-tRNA(Asn)/Glu-tRNA(Gln) amidotransferase C subunit